VIGFWQEKFAATGKRLDLRSFVTREPVILALLSVLAVVCFLAVTGLSRVYHAQQESLGNRWFTRGRTDLNAGRFEAAVNDFRTALLYSRDDYNYQLNLAEALIGLKRTSEAQAYLINLWDRQPENGLVNLELARIAAQRGKTEQALRYYHNAIYATWPGEQVVERREARLELIDFLLKISARTQAQSELIALAANLGNDPLQQAHVGDLFVRAQDYENGLAMYRLCLKSDHHNLPATAGAGLASFQLGRYALAQRYLQAAVNGDPHDTQSAALLRTTELVLRMDPFQRQLAAVQRDRMVMDAFATAGDRLKACSAGNASVSSASLEAGLSESWAKMKPHITRFGLQRNPDLVEATMELVFRIERENGGTCGVPSEKDAALLLIAKLHEGS
jgi:tetratricopeptide (TPR) repeat protein